MEGRRWKVVVEGDEKEVMSMVVVGVVMVVSERVKGVVVMTWPNKRASMSPEEMVKRWIASLLVAFGQLVDLRESFRIFSQMQIEGLRPNQYTYPSILRACTLVGALDLGEQIHSQVVKTGFQPNVYVSSVLIGNLETAMKFLRRLKERDDVSWTAMIAGYAQQDLFVEALKTFEEMIYQCLCMLDVVQQVNMFTYGSAVSAAVNRTNIRRIDSHSDMVVDVVTIGIPSLVGEDFTKETIRVEYEWRPPRCDVCKIFGHVHDQCPKKVVTLPIVSTSPIVTPTVEKTNDGFQTVGKKKKRKGKSKSNGGQLNWGNSLNKDNITSSNSFSALNVEEEDEEEEVENVFGDEAINLFDHMKWDGYTPNYVTFVGVFTACTHVRLVDKGLEYFHSMSQDYGLQPEHYASVVDIHGRSGLLTQALEIIESMPIEPDAMVWRTLLSACTVHKNKEIGYSKTPS
ncbi:pentatricopeptide repeat-containing protein [Tanacetum coccineum]